MLFSRLICRKTTGNIHNGQSCLIFFLVSEVCGPLMIRLIDSSANIDYETSTSKSSQTFVEKRVGKRMQIRQQTAFIVTHHLTVKNKVVHVFPSTCLKLSNQIFDRVTVSKSLFKEGDISQSARRRSVFCSPEKSSLSLLRRSVFLHISPRPSLGLGSPVPGARGHPEWSRDRHCHNLE